MIHKLGKKFTDIFQRNMPDAFVFALTLTLITGILALVWVDVTPFEVLESWYEGFWMLLEFGMQMVLLVITGYSIALSPLVKKGIDMLAKKIRSPQQVYLLVVFIGSLLCMISWGWVVITAVLGRELAIRIKGINYPFLIACVYFSHIGWVTGLSSSIPLLLNTEGNFIIEAGILETTIPTTETLGSGLNMAILVSFVLIAPLLMRFLLPKTDNIQTLESMLEPETEQNSVSIHEEARLLSLPYKAVSDLMNNSSLLQYLIAFLGIIYLGSHFISKGFDLNLNIMIFLFLMLGLLLGWAPEGTLAAGKLPEEPDRYGDDGLYLANFSCYGPEVALPASSLDLASPLKAQMPSTSATRDSSRCSMRSPSADETAVVDRYASLGMSADDDNLPERWCRPLSITIDGPAGSGKSTVARLVAESLGYQYIDTGATYRALAWLALDRGIPLDDPARLRGLALAQPAAQYHADGSWHVRIAGVDVSDRVREPAVGDAASKVARHDLVREVLVQQQRDIAGARDAVFDGRDAGTRIVPHADLKLYVTASFDERARRRCDQVGATGKERRAIEQAMRARDERDAPQSAIAEDALTVDTTDMGIDEVVDHIVNMWIDRRSDLLGAETIAGRDADSWIEGEARDGFQRLYRRLSPLYRAIFRVEYHGLDRIPEGGCLVVANHASMWDPGFIMKPMNEPVRYMSKLENTTLPIYNRMLDTTGSFPVRRGGGDRVAMHIAEMVLRRGDKLGVFPEGTRIYGEGLGQPRKGAARLALVAGVPVLPVAIYGNRYADTAFKVRVAFGTPLDFNHLRATPGNVTNATLEAWDHVTELWRALRQGSIS